MADIKKTESADKNTSAKEISIQVGLNGFSILREDKHATENAFKHHSFSGSFSKDEVIRKAAYLFENDELLKANFQNTRFIFLSQKSVLVPAKFFDANNLKKIFEFNQSLDELDELHYSAIPELGIYNVFTVPNYLASLVSTRYNHVLFQHQGTVLIRAAYHINKHTKSRVILVNVNRSFFDLVIFDNSELILYNSFEYANKTDFIYFVLYTLNQLNIETKEAEIIVLGENSDERGIRKELGSNFRSVLPIEKLTNFANSELKEPVQFRKFFCLFNH